MKEKEYIEDETLGRWLSGEMSEEELKVFKASHAYETYRHIAGYSSTLSAPSFNEEVLFDQIQSTKKSQKGHIIRMRYYRSIAVAATVVVLVGIGSLFFIDWRGVEESMVSVAVGNSETKKIVLPAKSTIHLNAVSSIEYDTSTWETERTVKLRGEAYFDVTKGKAFQVMTKSGTIAVLGTEFNVRERNGMMEISCFEGKVKVTDTHSKSVILTKEQSVKITNGAIVDDWSQELEETPDWLNGESSFYEASLETVLIELENQYGVKIERNRDYQDRLYTGTFIHGDLKEASKMIFLPMQLPYEIKSDSLIVIN